MASVQEVLDRAIHDVAFREAVLQDAAQALAPYGLSPADQDRVFQHVEMLTSGEEEEVALETETRSTDTGSSA